MTTDTRRSGPVRSVLLALLVVAAVAALVWWLRATSPVADTSAAGVPAAEVEPGMLLLCEDLQSDERTDAPARGRATSGQVLECPNEFDGMTVTYVGEVVGDVLDRRDGAWVLANDDTYGLVDGPLAASGRPTGTNSGLSVWLPDPFPALVSTPGRAGVRGDVIEIIGVVHRADPDDGGGLTIRAEEVVLLSPAVELDVPIHWRQVIAALVLAVLAAGLTVRDRRERRR